MKRMILLTCAALLVLGAGNAWAEIGWAGNVWPNTGADLIPTHPVDTYCQVWKDGVTDQGGQGALIRAVCEFSNGDGTWHDAMTSYNGDAGSNDEYTAQIPQWILAGAANIYVHWKFQDETDGVWYYDTNDQAGNAAPQIYNVVNVLPVNVTVQFTLCMSGESFTGTPCVIGSAAELGGWGSGYPMTQVDGDLWQAWITFAAGSNPTFEYKYKKNDCVDWESVDNRVVTMPTNNMSSLELMPDSWNNLPMGCGMGTTLEEQKVVCLQVCLNGVEYGSGVCATGGLEALTNWGDGAAMTQIGPDLYQLCLTFPSGTAIPLSVEYKFKKDACETWESVGNRVIVVNNTLASETTLTSTWDDGPGVCGVVASDETSWDALKSLYR